MPECFISFSNCIQIFPTGIKGTPLLTITPYGWPDIPYLSDLVIQCTVVNNTDFPPTLETKWRRNQVEVNISDSKYTGSSLDVYKPKLVINRVDFDQDNNDVYQCVARNSEGWGTSERTLRVDVKGSMFSICNQIRLGICRQFITKVTLKFTVTRSLSVNTLAVFM